MQAVVAKASASKSPQGSSSASPLRIRVVPSINSFPEWDIVEAEAAIPKTQDEVMLERSKSERRMARAKDLLDTQVAIVRQVDKKLKDHEAELSSKEKLEHSSPDFPVHSQTSSDFFRSTSSSWNPMDRKSATSHVAARAKQREERHMRFQERRQRVLNQELVRQEERRAADEEAAARRLERQDKRRQEEHRRHFLKQQMRNEQRKVLKEMQRAQDQKHERLYQEKVLNVKMPKLQQTGSKETEKDEEAVITKTISESVFLPSVAGKPPQKLQTSDFEQQGDILTDRLRSRAVYSEMLDRWNQIIAENDQRSDSTWVRMVGSEALMPESRRSRTDNRRSSRKEAKAAAIEAPPQAVNQVRPLSSYRREALTGSYFERGLLEDNHRLELARMRNLLRGEGGGAARMVSTH
mmetsp:Transcript_55833/g.103326  ORF Transcript_55833/g.103326 Transcript_55833/m.103326 type:complete len:409 (-) Transcript_55833:58-1284(-)